MRSEKIRKILSETSEETKESVRQYANKKIMEGNEVDKAADHILDAVQNHPRYKTLFRRPNPDGYICFSDGFIAGANWQKERENAELTRTSKELDDMTTKYNELSRKYDDLREHNSGLVAIIDREFQAAKLKSKE